MAQPRSQCLFPARKKALGTRLGMAHILSACPALAQTKYLARQDAVLKVLFFEINFDLGLIDTVPLWYSPIEPQSVYETAEVLAYRDVPVYGEYWELRTNRVDARIVNNRDKQVIALEISCPWVSNRDKKTSEKTMKYAPLRWEFKQRYPGYEINQCNIILDVLGGWSKKLDVTLTTICVQPWSVNVFSRRFTFQTRQFPRQLYRLGQWKCFVWTTKRMNVCQRNVARFAHV